VGAEVSEETEFSESTGAPNFDPVALSAAVGGASPKDDEQLSAYLARDCDGCIRSRAQLAELEGQHARADWWFSRAVNHAPSIPFAYVDWGEALLARGAPDLAIEKFKLANMKGPKFADPLEGWGEAQMAKNQSHLALAKFAEADQYAPNWGRLHLKWGEAPVYSGKTMRQRSSFLVLLSLISTQPTGPRLPLNRRMLE
jgi:tetratricopeptide (TPR) repeat protein